MRVANLFFRFLLSVGCALGLTLQVFSQVSAEAGGTFQTKPGWSVNPYAKKVFIENRGQFDGKDNLAASRILYGVDDLELQIYFSSMGITWRVDRTDVVGIKKEHEKNIFRRMLKGISGNKEHEEIYNEVANTRVMLRQEWIGANKNVQITASEPVAEYFNYMSEKNPVTNSIYFARAFKKVLYKNLYPKVDVEYTFHPDEGIKYTIILHPGADPSKIKMRYQGAKQSLVDATGNLHLVTTHGDFLDHAPQSFLKTGTTVIPVVSSFKLDGDIVSFDIDKYDASQTLIIDPWTTVPSGLLPNLRAFEIGRDAAGNVYVFGGTANTKLQKFDANGNPLWTFTSSYGNGHGDLAVDPAGNSYISEGCGTTGMAKVDPAGAMIWQNAGDGYEFWKLIFNCDYSKLVIGGSGGTGRIAYVNTSTGKTGAFTNISVDEIRSLCWSPGCNLYGVTLSLTNTIDCKLISITPDLTSAYSVVSGLVMNYVGPSYKSGGVCCCAAINIVAADNNYVYITDGTKLDQRDKKTGASLKSVVIPGGAIEANAGVVIDSCGNVYVGSQKQVYKYDTNLTAVGLPASVPGAVFDMVLGPNGEVLACGDGFVASLDMQACKPLGCANIMLSFTTTDASCNAKDGTATVIPDGTGPFTYAWSTTPVQTTQTATNLAAGTYTVTVTDAYKCDVKGKVPVKSNSGIEILTAIKNISCYGNNDGKASVTVTGGAPPYTYTWNTSPVQTTDTAGNLPPGDYTCTIKDGNGCETIEIVTISEPAEFKASVLFTTNANCFGESTGEAISTVTGGVAPYNYFWDSDPQQYTPTARNLPAGNYTLTVTDSNGCAQQAKVTITEPEEIEMEIVKQDVSCSGAADGWVSVNVSGGRPGYTYLWSHDTSYHEYEIYDVPAGAYTLTVTDRAGCDVQKTVTLREPAKLTATVLAFNDSCDNKNFASATVEPGGGTPPYTYSWNTTPVRTTQAVDSLAPGAYQVTITDGKGCKTTVPVNVASQSEDCFYFYIPDAFSPNGDNDNDGFKGIGVGIASYNLSIYNRWGARIFRSNNLDEPWNGGFENNQAKKHPTGIYIYVVKVTDNKGQLHSYMGTVALTE